MSPREKLKEIMKDNRLRYMDVALLLGVSLSTVRAWLRPVTSKASRPVPKSEVVRLTMLVNRGVAPYGKVLGKGRSAVRGDSESSNFNEKG